MTELFGRLAPGSTLDAARAELRVAHAAMARGPRLAGRRRLRFEG